MKMMKLYRPLCSDVTLRLAVDISPSYDDEDVADDDQDEQCYGSVDNATQELMYDNKIVANKKNCEENILQKQNIKHNNRQHQNNGGHSHSCSWYSRHNTPDKTAKDIYNHEHVSDSSLENYQTMSLDSEFKRCVEEEGNDFKEETHKCEMSDNKWENMNQNFPAENENIPQNNSQYFQLSSILSADSGSRHETCQPSTLCAADVSSNFSRYNNNTSQISWNNVDRNENICHTETRLLNADQDENADDENEDNSETYTAEASSASEDELPVDLDEDIDINDKMGMRQSMLSSYYGEIEEGQVEENIDEGMPVEDLSSEMSKSIAEEIHDVLLGDTNVKNDGQCPIDGVSELPFSYPFTLKHVGHLFDKSRHHFTAPEAKKCVNPSPATSVSTFDDHAYISQTDQIHTKVDITKAEDASNTRLNELRMAKIEDFKIVTDDLQAKKCSVSTMTAISSLELEVTHRGLHRFIPRHKDEMNIGIGDPIHVIKECDDLWCEGINLRTGERGIFPAMYANDLNFLEESDDEDDYWKFSMRFLGSVEVTSHKGDETLVQAINKVVMSNKGDINSSSLSTLEINQYGIRMIDKSKEGHEKDSFSHFFALKNISFCGTHPKNNRYFAFITKHPREYKFACHVFHGDRPTHRARDALGEAFKRFYQEYMAFTHPTEDIYME